MATIETKFSIGDTVYYANIIPTGKSHPCPDCKGERKWKAISPAGTEYSFSCPRCSTSFQGNSDLSLRYTAYAPAISVMTVGSVRVDTAADSGTQYMCRETGVGSGSIYYEADFFLTHEEATVAAQAKADGANTTVEWVAKLYNKTLSLSDYELSNAEREANKTAHSAAMTRIRDFFDDLEWSDDAEAMRKAISTFREAA
jgi:hypothetical protein